MASRIARARASWAGSCPVDRRTVVGGARTAVEGGALDVLGGNPRRARLPAVLAEKASRKRFVEVTASIRSAALPQFARCWNSPTESWS